MRFALAGLLVLSACSRPSEPLADASGDPCAEAVAFVPDVSGPDPEVSLQGGTIGPQRKTPTDPVQGRQTFFAFMERAMLMRGRDWREKDRLVAAQRPEIEAGWEQSYETLTAREMLRTLEAELATGRDSAAVLEAMGRYTRQYVDSGTHDGATVLHALRQLEGTWTPGERAFVARQAAAALGGYFAEKARCVGCTVEQALAMMGPESRASLEDHLHAVKSVHDRLQQIAQFGS